MRLERQRFVPPAMELLPSPTALFSLGGAAAAAAREPRLPVGLRAILRG